MALYLAGEHDADELLENDPFTLLVGMVLDQQIPLEKAFSGPKILKERLGGHLEASSLAAMDPDALVTAFSTKPALHRFPVAMATRVQGLAQIIVDQYNGDASSLWSGVSEGTEVFRRLKMLPGFGDQKAKIFLALLGKRLNVKPSGWSKVAGQFGERGTFVSIADIDGPDALLARVREHKRQMKAAAAQGKSPRKVAT